MVIRKRFFKIFSVTGKKDLHNVFPAHAQKISLILFQTHVRRRKSLPFFPAKIQHKKLQRLP